jgi:hypothetical protein
MHSPVIYNTAFPSLRDTDTVADATPRMLGGKRGGA